MRKSAKFPREIRQVTKIFAFSLATSEKPLRRPPRTAPLSPAARCVDVTSSRSSAPTASRATDRFNASRDDRRQPARAEPQRARQGVPRRRLRLRIRVYQQHGHVAHSRRRLGGGYVPFVMSIPAVFPRIECHRLSSGRSRVSRRASRLARSARARLRRRRAERIAREEEITNDERASDLWYRTRFTRSSPHRPAGVENEKQQTTFTVRTSRSNAT